MHTVETSARVAGASGARGASQSLASIAGQRRGEIGHGGVEGGLVEPRAVVEHGGDDARGPAEGIAVEGEHVLGAERNSGEGGDGLDGVVADDVRVARAHEHGGLVDRRGNRVGQTRRYVREDGRIRGGCGEGAGGTRGRGSDARGG